MKIKKIINNNVALIDRGGNELIVYMTGIAFKKKIGQRIDDSEIEKTYVLDSKDRLEHFSYLLSHSDDKLISLVNELVHSWEKESGKKANDYLYLALLDHLTFALKRSKKGQYIRSPLFWEVKKFYPVYYKIGLEALNKLEKYFNYSFPTDEAVSIALHFVNLQEKHVDFDEQIEDMKALRDILNIIKYHFHLAIDEDSINYMRLVTHLQYFIERLRKQQVYVENESQLFEQVKKLYPKAYTAVEKIEIYVKETFNMYLSKEEYTYLMVHVNRVAERGEKNE
ncbi:PRD domain-containing protein [Enterococcus ratti]|uniref:PRD domain-containing protein n=1 Tax=Enterococcus ratti TaxID=150033 RepID=A0A1L8WQR4_9ENTE|nr:PRD domain-containing protein [Enterococcus ratti]OJG83351.1 hypothetical protein RV14_GL001709 [Enterococcus ratti]